MMNEHLKHSDITAKVTGCTMKVHHNSLAIELDKAGFKYAKEAGLPIYYEEVKVGKRRVGLLMVEKIIVEVKAQAELRNTRWTKGLNYLKTGSLEIGLPTRLKPRAFHSGDG